MLSAIDEFDVDRFWDHVRDFLKRRDMKPFELACRTGLDDSNLGTALRYNRPPTLRTVIRIATVCDLSLDAYVIWKAP